MFINVSAQHISVWVNAESAYILRIFFVWVYVNFVGGEILFQIFPRVALGENYVSLSDFDV